MEYKTEATMILRDAIYEGDDGKAVKALEKGANPHHAIDYAVREKKASIVNVLYNSGARVNISQLLLLKDVTFTARLLEIKCLDMQEFDNAFFEYKENLRKQHQKIDYNFCNEIEKLISYPRQIKGKRKYHENKYRPFNCADRAEIAS